MPALRGVDAAEHSLRTVRGVVPMTGSNLPRSSNRPPAPPDPFKTESVDYGPSWGLVAGLFVVAALCVCTIAVVAVA